MAIGWVNDGDSWYYLSGSGAMVTGRIKAGGFWYYLGPDGAIFTDTQITNGRAYVSDGSGAWVG